MRIITTVQLPAFNKSIIRKQLELISSTFPFLCHKGYVIITYLMDHGNGYDSNVGSQIIVNEYYFYDVRYSQMACFLCRGWLLPGEPKFSIYFYLRLQPPLHTRKALIPNSINILYAADETLLYIGKKALKSIFLLCACLKTVLLKVDMATNHLQFVSSWS